MKKPKKRKKHPLFSSPCGFPHSPHFSTCFTLISWTTSSSFIRLSTSNYSMEKEFGSTFFAKGRVFCTIYKHNADMDFVPLYLLPHAVASQFKVSCDFDHMFKHPRVNKIYVFARKYCVSVKKNYLINNNIRLRSRLHSAHKSGEGWQSPLISAKFHHGRKSLILWVRRREMPRRWNTMLFSVVFHRPRIR